MFGMLRSRVGLPSPSMLVSMCALMVATGGVAFGAIPQSKTGVISACYDATRGSVRFIDAEQGRRCKLREKRLTWNADGKPGQPGPSGPTGPTGATGAQGGTGDPCAPTDPRCVGLQGDKGHAGAAGAAGDPGAPGDPGAKGDSGSKGEPGGKGGPGAKGDPGATGGQGPPGVVATHKISGSIAPVSPAADVWQFLGNQPTVATTSTQRLTASAMVPIATTGVPGTVKLAACYQNATTGGAINAFAGLAFSRVAVSALRVAQAVADTVVPGAGIWRVGVCTQTTITLDNNDWVNGYVLVTN